MRKFLTACCIVLLGTFQSSAQNISEKSNNEIIQLVSAQLFEQAAADFSLPPASLVAVEFPNNNSINLFLRNSILRSLQVRFQNLFFNNIAIDTTLKIDATKIQIVYSAPFTEHWFGAQKTERTVTVDISFELFSKSSGKILLAAAFQRAHNDTIRYSSIPDFEDLQEPLTIGKKPKLPFFQNVIEPAIITLAAGIAIYLFFTVRS